MSEVQPSLQQYLRQMLNWCSGELRRAMNNREAVDSIMLLDANGVVWQVTVNTSGVLTTTSVAPGGSV
jgi:hypothetical protein